MKPFPLTEELLAIAPRIIWFGTPEQALSNPIRFMTYAFTYATSDEIAVIQNYVDEDGIREALDKAPPGIIDPRSWSYWNLMAGRSPPQPMPVRNFDIPYSG